MGIRLFKYGWQKITGVVLLVLTAILLAAALLINSILTPILSKKLKAAVLKGTDSLYHVNFSHAQLQVFKGKAVLQNIVLTPNIAVYNKMKALGTAPNILYRVRIKQLLLNDAHPINLLLKKELEVDLIKLSNPQIQLIKYGNKPDTAVKDKRTLYQKISKSLKLIHVGEITLDNINLIYSDNTGKKPAVTELKKINLKAIDLLIDSTTQTDKSRTLFCKDITTNLYNFSGTSAKGLYTYHITSATFSTQTARLKIAGMNLQPLNSKLFFDKTQSDRFTFRMNAIVLNHFDFDTYFKEQILDVSSATINKGAIDVYSNPNPALSTQNKLITFPHWMLRKLKLNLNIDTLDVKEVTVSYKQYNKKAKKAGMVWFSSTSGRFLNITNRKAIIQKNNVCTANLSTYLMGKGKLNVSFAFNLSDPNYNFSYIGHLGFLDMRAANIAVMPLGAVKIESGRANSLDFNFHGTQKASTGTVKFLYQDAKISLLKDKDSKDYQKKPVLSLLANSFIVKGNNPDDANSIPRLAKVIYVRPANIPFFETMWLTLLKGIKACAGVGKAKEQEAVKKPLTKKEERQQKRALKKARKEKEKEEKRYKKELEKKAKEAAKNN
jgi:hypothetical protein